MGRYAAWVETQSERKQHSDARIPLGAGHAANCAAVVVVVLLPCRGTRLCVSYALEQFDCQELITKPTVEARGVAVLPQTA